MSHLTTLLRTKQKSARKRANRFWREHGYNRGDTILRNKPEVLGIESTNYCNIKCIMCPRGEPDIMRRPLGHMDNGLLERVIDQAEFFTSPSWIHWFGEPLMNPQLFDQIAIAKRKVPNLGISTNATLLRRQQQAAILDSPLDTVIIAIDGATKEVYESVRKSARFTFEEVRENATEFLAMRRARGQKKPHVILSMIALDVTEPGLEEYRAFWLEKGADEVMFKSYVNWGGQEPGTFDDLATVKTRAALGTQRAHPCKFLWESLLVAWDGKVVPCCYDFDTTVSLGDLKTQTLDEIWNGPAYVALRAAELAGTNGNALCQNCSQAPGHARDPNWGRMNPRTWTTVLSGSRT